MSDLQEIMQLLDGAQLKTDKVSSSIGYSSSGSKGNSLRRELSVLNMYTVALERWSGNDTLSGLMNEVQKVQRVILRMYMLTMAVQALAAGPTPFGLLYLGSQVLGLGMTLSTLGQ